MERLKILIISVEGVSTTAHKRVIYTSKRKFSWMIHKKEWLILHLKEFQNFDLWHNHLNNEICCQSINKYQYTKNKLIIIMKMETYYNTYSEFIHWFLTLFIHSSNVGFLSDNSPKMYVFNWHFNRIIFEEFKWNVCVQV